MEQKKTRSDESGNDVTDDDKSVKTRHQVESAWSWIVDAGVMSTLILFMGVERSYGLFFVEMQSKYGVSASAVSLIGGTMAATFSLGALIVLTFALNIMSERQCALVGVCLMTSAFSLSSLVTSFPVFVVTLGAATGTSIALIYGPSFVLLGKYFDRHLTLAQAIANTGASAGNMLMPYVVRAVLDEYSFPAGLLVIGGILSHMFIAASLFRPVESKPSRKKAGKERLLGSSERAESQGMHGLRSSVEQKSEDRLGDAVDVKEIDPCLPLDEDTLKEKHGVFYEILQRNTDRENRATESCRNSVTQTKAAEDYEPEIAQNNTTARRTELQKHSPLPLRDRAYSESGKDRPAFSVQGEHLHRSFQKFPISQEPPKSNNELRVQTHSQDGDASHRQSKYSLAEESHDALHSQSEYVSHTQSGDTWHSPREAGGCWSSLKSKVCVTDACRNPVMWALVLCQVFGVLAGALGPAFLPPVAKEKGLSDNEAAFLLTLLGGLDIASRLMPGVIAHYKLMKPHQMVILSLTLQGLLYQFLTFFNSFEAMVGFCVGFGSLSGVFFTMTHATIIEFVGLEGFRLTFGFSQLFNGISVAVGFPIVGVLKDITGSYVTSFHFLGATAVIAASILVSLSCRLQKKREGKGDKHLEQISEPEEVIPL